jgi:tetratricopeptide (TPR) repeat protein
MTKACLAVLLSAVLIAMSAPSQTKPSSSSSTPAKKTARKFPIGEGRVGSGAFSAKMNVVPDLNKRLAKWKPIKMPFNPAGLTANERKMVEKLVFACNMLESAFWRQSDPQALVLYKQLAKSTSPKDVALRKFLFINGSRFDLIDDNKPFVGTDPKPGVRGYYPEGTTREQLEQYVKDHPEKKAEIYSGYTVVRRNGNDLEGIPYHVAFAPFIEPAAKALREAAALSPDKDFANFLRLRAEALLTDDYYKSDLAWVDLKDPKVDVIMAPYETYLDDILGVKTSYGPAVLIRNEAESKKLEIYQRYIDDIQQALPLPPEDKPSKKGQPTPMEVMDAPFRTGDMLHGYQAVADNLPNDPRIHQEKGTKKIFFKNFMDARVNYVILPLAKRLMVPEQAKSASGAGYLAHTLLHEISHGIGPAFARKDGKQVDIREAIGPIYGGLEEAKADVVGMFGLIWLMDNGAISKTKAPEFYASYLAGNFRTMRFGVAEAHGMAEMMEFNYLSEQGVYTKDANGRYHVNYDKMPAAITSLAKELLEIEATGDRDRAEKWFARYDKMPDDLKKALDAITDIPVDVFPEYSWKVVVK